MPTKISEAFDKALSDRAECAGLLTAECVCGRRHFATGRRAAYDPGELEQLQEKKRTHAAKYIEHEGTDSVYVVDIGAGRFVWDCPCDKLAALEAVWWNNRHLILTYINNRTSAMLEDINRTSIVAEVQKRVHISDMSNEQTTVELPELQPWKSGHPDEVQTVGRAKRGGQVVAELIQKRNGTRITKGDMEAGGLIAGKLPDPDKMVFPPATQTQHQQPNT